MRNDGDSSWSCTTLRCTSPQDCPEQPSTPFLPTPRALTMNSHPMETRSKSKEAERELAHDSLATRQCSIQDGLFAQEEHPNSCRMSSSDVGGSRTSTQKLWRPAQASTMRGRVDAATPRLCAKIPHRRTSKPNLSSMAWRISDRWWLNEPFPTGKGVSRSRGVRNCSSAMYTSSPMRKH